MDIIVKKNQDLTGDKTIQERVGPSGTGLASEVTTYRFTTNEMNPDTRKYIPIAHLSIETVSSETTQIKKKICIKCY